VPDPVSWMVVEPGWGVVASDGEDIGTVDEVLGDHDSDIFDGLSVSPGRLRRPRYVPAEVVRAIYDDVVEIDLTPSQFERLPEYTGSPPGSDVLAGLLETFADGRD
jgi:uncharacterized protein YrrD